MIYDTMGDCEPYITRLIMSITCRTIVDGIVNLRFRTAIEKEQIHGIPKSSKLPFYLLSKFIYILRR